MFFVFSPQTKKDPKRCIEPFEVNLPAAAAADVDVHRSVSCERIKLKYVKTGGKKNKKQMAVQKGSVVGVDLFI